MSNTVTLSSSLIRSAERSRQSPHPSLVVGTRGSALAQWQTEHVIAAIKNIAPELVIETRIIKTTGDKDQTRPLAELGGLGVFTREIEHALRDNEIDLAVHSLKDLPTTASDALFIAALLPRQDARDVIVSRHRLGLKQLPGSARIGTSSARRAAQILAMRPDVKIIPLRGNVDTRLRKAATEEYDAIVLAAAGLARLGRAEEITEYLALDEFLPDPGQGALAVQIRANDAELVALLAHLDDAPTRAAVTAERAFLQTLGGGCRMPMGAYAELEGESLRVRGMVAALDGTEIVRGEIRGARQDAAQLGKMLAKHVLENGAAKILDVGAFHETPLRHKRILITRAREQADELAEKIRARGGEPIEFPTIEFAPLEHFSALDDALARVNEFDWIVFTSANGARAVDERVRALHSNGARFEKARVAAIGPGTARALEALGIRVAFVPTKFLGEQIARELPIEAEQRALLLRADIASPALADGLRARGVVVHDVDAYRTGMPAAQKINLDNVDAITFTSSSTARNFFAMLDDDVRAQLSRIEIFCIGPVTANTARELGLRVSASAEEHTLDGLVKTMIEFYEKGTHNA